MAKAKTKAYDELYEGLDTKEEKIHCTEWRDRDTKREKDIQQGRMMKDTDGKVMTDEESVLIIWKEYYKGLTN